MIEPHKPSNSMLHAEMEISHILANKMFGRLAEKTQVAFPRPGQPEVVRTRQPHSHEVANSSAIMGFFIDSLQGWTPNSVDYKGSLKPCSLLHDLGHGALSHPGAELLDKVFKDMGLSEGFSDNNNTLVVIEKNEIAVSDHTIASVIKYPKKLYPDQVERYLPILEKAIADDAEHFKSLGLTLMPQTRTIACQIMDEADRNTYICSDLSDFLCLGNTISVETLKEMSRRHDATHCSDELLALIELLRTGNKSTIKSYFNMLKNRFNTNFRLTPNGLEVINKTLHDYREFLWEVEFELYITPLRADEFHLRNMARLQAYIDKVMNTNFYPSKTYRRKIEAAEKNGDTLGALRAKRDMIGEVTDWYITKIHHTAASAASLPSEPILGGGLYAPIQPETLG